MTLEELIPLRLAREGYGSLRELDETPTNVVMDAFYHSCFQNEFAETMVEMNREADA